eukprot:403369345
MFDYLDFVMIDGDGNMLPWQKKCQRIGMLFRMCKRTNKCVFTSGIGMQFLVYFCATNFLNLQVINGQEKGGPLTSIKEVDARFLDILNPEQVYLDNLTGDYYTYQAMASLGGVVGGDLIKKVSTYQAKGANNLKPVLFYSKLTDVRCSLKKQYISHYLAVDIPQEFVVENKNTWDPHPINITNIDLVQQNYETIAESERGPQIAIHKNTLALQFQVDKKYKETVQIMLNFVNQKMQQIQNVGRLHETLDQANMRIQKLKIKAPQSLLQSLASLSAQKEKQKSQRTTLIVNDYSEADKYTQNYDSNSFRSRKISTMRSVSKDPRPQTANPNSEIKQNFTKEFKHSGLGYSKNRHQAVVVDNNAVSQTSIPAATVKDQAKKLSLRSSFGSQNYKQHLRNASVQNTNDGSYQKYGTNSTTNGDGVSAYQDRGIQSQRGVTVTSHLSFNQSRNLNTSQNFQASDQSQLPQSILQSGNKQRPLTVKNSAYIQKQKDKIQLEENVYNNYNSQQNLNDKKPQDQYSLTKTILKNPASQTIISSTIQSQQRLKFASSFQASKQNSAYASMTMIPSVAQNNPQNDYYNNQSARTINNNNYSMNFINYDSTNNNSIRNTARNANNMIDKQMQKRLSIKHLKDYIIEKQFREQYLQDAQNLWKNQNEIKQMLHPTLDKEHQGKSQENKKETHTKNNSTLNSRNTFQNSTNMMCTSRSSKNLFLPKEKANIIDQTPNKSVFSRYKEFAKLPLQSLDVPVIRNASPYIGCEEEQKRKEDLENKKTWLNKNQNFLASFGKATTNSDKYFIKNYVTADPSPPPMLHQFRGDKKDEWVGNGNFKF